MKGDPANERYFEGGGNAYWNVRVVSLDRVESEGGGHADGTDAGKPVRQWLNNPSLTATEALTALAFGVPAKWDKVVGWHQAFAQRWRVSPPATDVLRLLEARGSSEPFYPWLPVMSYGGSVVAGYKSPFASSSRWIEGSIGRFRLGAPELARAIRGDHRRRLGRLVTYAELAAMLRAELEEDRDRAIRWDEANRLLRNAILGEQVTAWAVRADDPKQEHVRLPAQVAFRPIQFREDQVESDSDATMADFAAIHEGTRWVQVRFRLPEILALGAKNDALRALDMPTLALPVATTPEPFPSAGYVPAWEAIAWKAFNGSWATPGHVSANRSFDHGTGRRHDEAEESYAGRQEEHRQFDAAEKELLNLLASGRATAKGQPPAHAASGERLQVPATQHVDIPASTFLNEQLAFSCGSNIIQRLPMLERLFPPHELRGSDADPSLPAYYNVVIVAGPLRKLWTSKPTFSPETDRLLTWLVPVAEESLRHYKTKPKQSDLIQGCVDALRCTHRDAKAAVQRLPEHLRRGKGERE